MNKKQKKTLRQILIALALVVLLKLLPALPAALGSNGRKQDGIYAAFCDMPPPPGGWTALVSAETAALLGK